MCSNAIMVFHLSFFIIFSVASLFIQLSSSAVLAPITQDRSSRLYSLSLYTETPSQASNLLLDLGASFSWVDCSRNYTSSTYHSIPCASSLCNALGSHVCSGCSEALPSCSNNSCFLFLSNPKKGKATTKVLAIVDSLALPITDGHNPGRLNVVPEFIFSCSSRSFFKGHIPRGTTSLAGLGRSNFSLMAQLGTAFTLPRVFALCLSSSPSAPGVAFFGTSGPYYFLPEVDLSKDLVYTPLLVKPAGASSSVPRLSEDYFIGLTAIKVNGKGVHFDINVNDFGRAMLSTVTPYTALHSSIYKPLVEAFVNESAALNLSVTLPVRPFNVCYDAADVMSTRLGPVVPTVDFVMQSDNVLWRVHGSNSMVRISNERVDVWCLAFVDGGTKPRSSVVIGGHQMVDNLLQFDLESKRLGFSSSVLVHNTMCANFNFTLNYNLR